MITGEIKLYDEPAPYTYSSGVYGGQSAWKSRSDPEVMENFDLDLKKTKQLLPIGATFETTYGTNTRLVVVGYEENIQTATWYQERLCTIKALNPQYNSAGSRATSYTLEEVKMDSIELPENIEGSENE